MSEVDECESFYSHGQNLAKAKSKSANSYERKKKALELEKVDQDETLKLDSDNFVAVQNNSKKFVSQSNNNKTNNWRFNASTENPHEAQAKQDRLTRLIIERAQKLKH